MVSFHKELQNLVEPWVWPSIHFYLLVAASYQSHQTTPATLTKVCREHADEEEINSNDGHTGIDADTFQLETFLQTAWRLKATNTLSYCP